MHSNAPLGFINEREYEVVKTIGLLREAQNQQINHVDVFNRSYTFDLYPVSTVHGVNEPAIDKYFYAMLGTSGTSLSDNFIEPEFARAGNSGGIIAHRRIAALIKGSVDWCLPANPICIRVKRPDNIKSIGTVLRKKEFWVRFG